MAKKRSVKPKDVVLEKLSKIESRLQSIEEKVSKDMKTDAMVLKEEKSIDNKLEDLKKGEVEIEKVLFKIGAFNVKKKHALELIRASAGAFLGVGLGKSLLDLTKLATTLPWINTIGILIFVLAISFLLVYKNKRTEAAEKGMKVVWTQLIVMYVVSLAIETLAIFLFGGSFASTEVLTKTLIIGSYSAMAGAVSFSII